MVAGGDRALRLVEEDEERDLGASADAHGAAILRAAFGLEYGTQGRPELSRDRDYYLCSLKHRTVAGKGARGSWEFSVVRGIHAPRPTLYARLVLAQGARIVDVELPLCTNLVPAPGAWPVSQSSPGTWRVACSRYGADLNSLAEPTAFSSEPGFPIGPMLLLGAPPDVDSELREVEKVLLER